MPLWKKKDSVCSLLSEKGIELSGRNVSGKTKKNAHKEEKENGTKRNRKSQGHLNCQERNDGPFSLCSIVRTPPHCPARQSEPPKAKSSWELRKMETKRERERQTCRRYDVKLIVSFFASCNPREPRRCCPIRSATKKRTDGMMGGRPVGASLGSWSRNAINGAAQNTFSSGSQRLFVGEDNNRSSEKMQWKGRLRRSIGFWCELHKLRNFGFLLYCLPRSTIYPIRVHSWSKGSHLCLNELSLSLSLVSPTASRDRRARTRPHLIHFVCTRRWRAIVRLPLFSSDPSISFVCRHWTDIKTERSSQRRSNDFFESRPASPLMASRIRVAHFTWHVHWRIPIPRLASIRSGDGWNAVSAAFSPSSFLFQNEAARNCIFFPPSLLFCASLITASLVPGIWSLSPFLSSLMIWNGWNK